MDEDVRSVVEIITGVVLSILGWLGIRTFRQIDRRIDKLTEIYQAHDARLIILEKSYVTRGDLQENMDRSETRSSLQHVENKGRMQNIEDTIVNNNKEAKDDRRELLNKIQDISANLATLTGQKRR